MILFRNKEVYVFHLPVRSDVGSQL